MVCVEVLNQKGFNTPPSALKHDNHAHRGIWIVYAQAIKRIPLFCFPLLVTQWFVLKRTVKDSVYQS